VTLPSLMSCRLPAWGAYPSVVADRLPLPRQRKSCQPPRTLGPRTADTRISCLQATSCSTVQSPGRRWCGLCRARSPLAQRLYWPARPPRNPTTRWTRTHMPRLTKPARASARPRPHRANQRQGAAASAGRRPLSPAGPDSCSGAVPLRAFPKPSDAPSRVRRRLGRRLG